MQPVKLIIPGRYWDTQIYSGRLYAFTVDGEIVTINWDSLIENFDIGKHFRIPFEYAFQHSNLLYLEHSLNDPDVRELMIAKFERLGALTLEVKSEDLEASVISKQRSPFRFPHADSTIYKNSLYVASQSGVFKANCNKKTKYGVSTKVEKHWDGSVFRVAASYNRLALAAGDDGLFELALEPQSSRQYLKNISSRQCTSCSWAFYSIYGSSHATGGFLADYNREQRSIRQMMAAGRNDENVDENGRRLKGIIPEEAIFHEKGYSWAAQNRICMARNGSVRITNYAPSDEDGRLRDLGEVQIGQAKHGRVLAGAVALFGTLVEYEGVLVALLSDGSSWNTSDEVVSWRVFGRSRNYENQLHIIYDDRLEVVSFNNDYFVDQANKISGITFRSFGSFPSWDSSRTGAYFEIDERGAERALPSSNRKLLPGKSE